MGGTTVRHPIGDDKFQYFFHLLYGQFLSWKLSNTSIGACGPLLLIDSINGRPLVQSGVRFSGGTLSGDEVWFVQNIVYDTVGYRPACVN